MLIAPKLIARTYFLVLLTLVFATVVSHRAYAQCITSFPYSTDFEASPGGWTTGGTASDWAYGKPAKSIIKNAYTGTKCWIVGGLNKSSYNDGELSWVQSPCFDFTNVKYPSVGFHIYWESEYGYDGTVFQYSTDNGNTWKTVGSDADAKNCFNMNWYNTSSVRYLTGRGNGWSGSSGSGGSGCGSGNGSNGWVLASHTMPYLANVPKVQFRFLFGAGTSCNAYNGFAFDDFTVGNALPNFATYVFSCTNSNTVSFTNTSLFCPTLSWNFGDPSSGASNTSTSATPTHIFSGPGQYSVSLTASGPDNAPSTTTKIITILDVKTSVTAPVLCNGDKTGAVLATANSASANFSWNSSPVQNTAAASGLGAGNYTVTVTGTNICAATSNISLVDPAVLSNTVAVTQPTCNNNNGSISLTSTGGTAPYKYNWAPNVTITNTANGLGAGDYAITITDANNCTDLKSAKLLSPSTLTAAITSVKDVQCNGNKNGEAVVSASGGTGALTYAWSPYGGTNATATALGAGNFTITVSDAQGCSVTANASIKEPAVLTSAITATDAACGKANGAASAVVSGGVAPYTYAWSPGSYSSASISGLSANSYNLTTTDKNGCTVSDQVVIKDGGIPISISVNKTDVNCFGDKTGAISLVITGGTAPYGVLWSNGSTSTDLTGLAAGNYAVTVTDAQGCTSTANIALSQPAAALNLSLAGTDATCFGATGSIQSTVTGGTPAYQFSWNPGNINAANLNNALAGTYKLNVTDKNGCTAFASHTIKEPVAIDVKLTTQQASCGLANGAISTTVSGGVTPYKYAWNPGNVTTANISAIGAGQYTLTVTDKNNCQSTATGIINPSSKPIIQASSINVKCFGSKTGSITLTISSGVAPFTTSWSNGATGTAITDLAAGTYTATVTDATGCSNTTTVTITQPVAALKLTLTKTDASCFGTAGSVLSTVSGGTPAYKYAWSNGVTSASLTAALAGTFSLTVTDANGCIATETATVAEPAELKLQLTAQQASCGLSNGAVSSNTSGGTKPYQYAWKPGNTTMPNLTAIGSGQYSLKVTDKNNCEVTATATITSNAAPTIQAISTDVKCFGDKTGTAKLTITNGVAPYTTTWSNAATGTSLSNLGIGTYTATVKDAAGCSSTTSVVINQPATKLAVTLAGTDALCFGGTGAIKSTVTGGTAAYQYNWLPGNVSTADISNASAGSYALDVTDKNGCTASASYVVKQPTAVDVKLTVQQANCGLSNASVKTAVSGGFAPYQYAWTPGNVNTTTLGSIGAGQYTVTVTDNNNCKASATATVNPTTAPTVQANTTDVKCFGDKTGAVQLTIANGAAPYTTTWSNGASGISLANLATGTYTATVKDAAGCTNTASVTITQPATKLDVQLSAVNALCFQGTGSIASQVTGGTAGYTYAWSGGQTTSLLNGVAAGNYSLTVTDKNACVASAAAVITAPSAITIKLAATDAACGVSNGAVTSVITGGVSPYAYSWNSGQNTANVSGLAVGNYTLSLTDKNGCKATQSVSVLSAAKIVVNETTTPVACNGGTSGSAAVSVSGGTPGYSYTWSNGATTAGIKDLKAGSYSVTIKDAAGCTEKRDITITQPTVLSISLATQTATCNSLDGSITSLASGGLAPYQYAWSAGAANGAQLSNIGAGNYNLTITDQNGCTKSAAATVGKINPLTVNLGIDTSICGGNGLLLNPGNFVSYRWQDNSANSSFAVSQTGRYYVTVIDARGCTAADTINVSADCGELWFPSGFTPNGDNRNDKFGALGDISLVSGYSLVIFNRWGEKVFETTNPAVKWDGYYKQHMLAGNYVWFAHFKNKLGEQVQRKGTIVLVR